LFTSPSRSDLEAWPRALATLAAVVDVRGESVRADALLHAAQHVETLPAFARWDLARAAKGGHPLEHDWATAVAAELAALATRGTALVVGNETARLPSDIAAMLRLPDIDPSDVLRAHRRHGIVSAADIAAEAAFDEAREHTDEIDTPLLRLAQWLPSLRGERARLPLGRAVALVDSLTDALDDPASVGHVFALGSIRRYEPTVGDIEVLLVHPDPPAALAAAIARLAPTEVRHRAARRAVVHVSREEVGLRACTPAEAPFVSLWHTGAAAHVQQLRQHAVSRGLRLRPDGLRDASGAPVSCTSEDDVFAALGLAPIPPELRHGSDEVELASQGPLPALVEVSDIRGDFHTHTLYSDGRDSVETMVLAARALGYEYVAITDHSPSAAANRVLTLDRIERQLEDVDAARRRAPGITVLYGVEVDILPDGSLDLPDHVLDTLDIVLASLHDSAGHGPERLLSRYLSAMRDPRVNLITHPANRLVGRDDGYALDYDALFSAARETGTALEIDGGPGHLDMDGDLARRAVDAGVTVTIDSDCHHARRLGRQMRLGVGTARRGGVQAKHVLNARPLAEVQKFFAAKRAWARRAHD
jgi:DNA polymerase (family 10)